MTRAYFALILLLACLSVGSTAARSGHIAALAVAEENDTVGSVADMYLEIRPGTGTVYIESIPFTKIDTQISTRIANEIACQRSSVDCSRYDFFYVIKVPSSLIGGPSAGGALTVLTYAVLEDKPIRNDTAMTGAILSGGIIGPVGGVHAKVAAAAANGFGRVLVPAWEANDTYIPLDDRYNISVYRITSVDEAIALFTGTSPPPTAPITPPQAYVQRMQAISKTLCEHSRMLREQVEEASNRTRQIDTSLASAANATDHAAYYSAASKCFAASLGSHTIILENATNETRAVVLQQVVKNRLNIRSALEATPMTTLADLEVAMVVTERLHDVETSLAELNGEIDPATLAYSYERLETARAWLTLSGSIPSEKLSITPESLKQSCLKKISEAQERVHYLSYLYPSYTEQLEDSLREAFDAAQADSSALCLLEASQAKAEANALLTAIYVPDGDMPAVVQAKINASHHELAKAAADNVFPILGYSYSEYSEELVESEPYSASLYSEYSLELSRLAIYFPQRSHAPPVDGRSLIIFSVGVVLGCVVGIIASFALHRSHRPKNAPLARSVPGKKR